MSSAVNDDAQIDASRSSPGSPTWPVVVIALLGVFGLVAGLAVGAVRHVEPSATTRILVVRDPALPFETTAGGNDDADRFVQTEALVIGGADLRAAVSERLGLESLPAIDVVQVGVTSVVEVTTTAATAEEASQIADAVVETYQAQRRGAYVADADRAAGTLDSQLTDVRAALDSEPGTGGNPAAGTSSLATEYARLLALRNEVELSATLADNLVPVVQRPMAAEPAGSIRLVRPGLLGLLLGVVLGLVAVLARRWWAQP